MSSFTVLILIAFAVGAFCFTDEETKLNFSDELSSSEDIFNQIGEWEGRIVGGRDARPGQFPHQVSLRVGIIHICGGSILNRLYVLTAAHCAQNPNVRDYRVIVGALRRLNDGINHEVQSIHNHPRYSGANRTNDISIIRTVNNILFDTRYVRPVRLPIFNVPEAGNLTVYVSGWGHTSHGGVAADILQFKSGLTLNREECVARYGASGRYVHETTVCVQNPVGDGVCTLDSGSPLITQLGVQVGIVSWGRSCGRELPDVYENVWSHIRWIRATSRLNRD